MNAARTDIAVAVYDTHVQAEAAVKALQGAGFDVNKESTARKADRFMLPIHGAGGQIVRAHDVLEATGLASFDHRPAQASELTAPAAAEATVDARVREDPGAWRTAFEGQPSIRKREPCWISSASLDATKAIRECRKPPGLPN